MLITFLMNRNNISLFPFRREFPVFNTKLDNQLKRFVERVTANLRMWILIKSWPWALGLNKLFTKGNTCCYGLDSCTDLTLTNRAAHWTINLSWNWKEISSTISYIDVKIFLIQRKAKRFLLRSSKLPSRQLHVQS